MLILKILKPFDFSNQGRRATPYIRLTDKKFYISKSLVTEIGLVKHESILDVALIRYNDAELYALLINGSNDGFLLTGDATSYYINSSMVAAMVASHYHLEAVIGRKSEFKSHCFNVEILDIDGLKAIVLLPPKKYEP